MKTREAQRIDEFIERYVSLKAGTDAGHEDLEALFLALLEYWAAERDHEIKNQLLNQLAFKYAHAVRKLVDLNQLKSRFLGIAAHDLRNPLTSIRGLSEILLSGAAGSLTQEQHEYLSIINTASDGMLALVNNLLDISVIESGKLEIQTREDSLQDVITERIRIYRNLAKEKNITLAHDLSQVPDHPFDRSKIAQVVDNLLGNAIKFSHPDSRITVSLDVKGSMARVSVTDEGVGIPAQEQAHIFGEFQKASVRPTGGEKCTGLGLAIAKRIVEAHQGSLSVVSQIGAGSTFTFTLPLGSSDDGS